VESFGHLRKSLEKIKVRADQCLIALRAEVPAEYPKMLKTRGRILRSLQVARKAPRFCGALELTVASSLQMLKTPRESFAHLSVCRRQSVLEKKRGRDHVCSARDEKWNH
jgi:hypothetical protein